MKLDGEYMFNGPREEVWKLVRDPDVLASALPGTQSLEKVSENEYEGDINIRIGPVVGVFSGRLVVSNEQPPESCTLAVEGQGKPGFIKGTGNVNLTDQGDSTTLMTYDGDLQIGGRLASVGQRMIDTASKSMIRQGLGTLNEALEARVAAKEEGTEVEHTAPTESEFAAAVAKDMAGEVLTHSRLIWIGAAIIVIIIVVVVLANLGGG
ncbi:MAG: carbon monoxide dehydrogenase subunit G [Anaerolineales bacterium]|nr:carbon monoxide dehydrogenase subunit G [Anaerolineales bacterium]